MLSAVLPLFCSVAVSVELVPTTALPNATALSVLAAAACPVPLR